MENIFLFFPSPVVLLPSVDIRANDFLGYDVMIDTQSFKPKRGLRAHPAQVLHFKDKDTGSSRVNWEDLQNGAWNSSLPSFNEPGFSLLSYFPKAEMELVYQCPTAAVRKHFKCL